MRIFLTILLVILLVIAALIALLCLVSVTLSLEWWDGRLRWNVRLWGIKLLPRRKKSKPARNKARTKTKDKNKKTEKSPEAVSEEAEAMPEDFLMDKLGRLMMKIAKYSDLAGSAFFSIPGPLRRIGRAFTLSHLRTDIVIANEDAAQCARTYGLLQVLTQEFLRNTGKIIRVRRKRVQMVCDFTADECRWNVGFRLNFRLGPVLLAGVIFFWNFLRDVRRAKKTVVSKKL